MKSAPLSLLDYRNTNSLWGSVLVETLFRLGVREAVISPGSRSTPLTMAFARHAGFQSVPVLDERSAAFFALGMAKQSRRPVVLLCTSGTAGANYFPAVIEAQESGVPLIVITADRPPEMRECRSGQTIDQQKLFGSHVNFFHECAVPVASVAMLRYLRQTVAHAVERTRWPVGGPVHLNAPFRDPLPPVEDGLAAPLRGQFDEERFFAAFTKADAGASGGFGNSFSPTVRLGGRGVIVAGQDSPARPEEYARAVGQLASKLGWPVLADALSPLRNYARLVPGLITTYDVLARAESLRTSLRPDQVLCLSDWPTSKPLRQWLEASDIEITFVRPQGQNPDALHGRTTCLRCPVESLGHVVRPGAKVRGWLAAWQRGERRAAAAILAGLKRMPGMFEGQASALLPGILPPKTPLFVANSMPVRDLEYFWPANDRAHAVHCNRGANGIDGTLSTALGLAQAATQPAVLLTGDLAFLHDTNGLLSVPKFTGGLTVVLINNGGGGIFGHLPVAQFNPPFEEFFATPQRVDFGKLCAAYGVEHRPVGEWREFGQLLKKLPKRGVRVLELRTDRAADAAARKALFARATEAAAQ